MASSSTPKVRPALVRKKRADPVEELLAGADQADPRSAETPSDTGHEAEVSPAPVGGTETADHPVDAAGERSGSAPAPRARARRQRRTTRGTTPSTALPGRVRGLQREVTLNLSGRARELLESQRAERGVGLTAAAVEALTSELADLVRELARPAPASEEPSPGAFPARRAPKRRRVEHAQRVGLLLTPAEADALAQAAEHSGVSMSQLVTDAVERHFGPRDD